MRRVLSLYLFAASLSSHNLRKREKIGLDDRVRMDALSALVKYQCAWVSAEENLASVQCGFCDIDPERRGCRKRTRVVFSQSVDGLFLFIIIYRLFDRTEPWNRRKDSVTRDASRIHHTCIDRDLCPREFDVYGIYFPFDEN